MFICPRSVRTGKTGDPIEEAPGRGARVRFGPVRDEFGNHGAIAGDVDGAGAFGLVEDGSGVVAQIAHAEPLGFHVLADGQIGDSDILTSHSSKCSTAVCYTTTTSRGGRGAPTLSTPVSVYSVSTGELRQLGSVEAAYFTWPPDGSTLAYQGGEDDPNELWLVDANGANKRRLSPTPARRSTA